MECLKRERREVNGREKKESNLKLNEVTGSGM